MTTYCVLGTDDDGTYSVTGPFRTLHAAGKWMAANERDGTYFAVMVLEAP